MNRERTIAAGRVGLIGALVFVVFGCSPLTPSRPGRAEVVRTARAVPAKTHPTETGPGETMATGKAVTGYAEHRSAEFPAGRPADFQAFKERYRLVGRSPGGAVRMYFDALYSYIDPARKAEGAKMLRYVLHEGPAWENAPSLGTFVSRLRNPAYHYIFRSFAEGTSPANDYAMNPDNYRLMFAGSRQEIDYVSVQILSSGADNPRLLQARQFEDGLWYLTGFSGTYTEVRRPVGQIPRGGHDADLDP
jgi:hypothetical protein